MPASARPIRFYRFALSGHSHRVELFLSLLGLPVEAVDVDLAGGAQKKPDFLAKNPFGRVPVIEDGATTLAGVPQHAGRNWDYLWPPPAFSWPRISPPPLVAVCTLA